MGSLIISVCTVVLVLAITKPAAIWKMKKIQLFEKVIGRKRHRGVFLCMGASLYGFRGMVINTIVDES